MRGSIEVSRAASATSLEPSGPCEASVLLAIAEGEEGDPDNRLAEIRFDAYPGGCEFARQFALLADLLGAGPVSRVEHDEALLEASRRAKARLPELRERFREGLEPGSCLLVKAPFSSGKVQEWMWVEVIHWDRGKILGLLQNEPHDVLELRTGDEVEVDEEDVFDYMMGRPDGSFEGNETGEILEQRTEEPKD